ncbi:MAG: cation-transporting P-type ATPase, partial [Chromatiales bacterium]
MTQQDRVWHEIDAEDVIGILQSGKNGLSGEEARQRLEIHGLNRLPEPPRRSALIRFLAHFHNILIYVLLGSAVI